MGVRNDELTQYIQRLETLKADIPAIMSKIAAGEGAYAVKQARLICKNDNVANTGAYRRNWQSDKAAKRSGRRYHAAAADDYSKWAHRGRPTGGAHPRPLGASTGPAAGSRPDAG